MKEKRRRIEFYDHDLLSATPLGDGASIKQVVVQYLATGPGGQRTVSDTANHLVKSYVSVKGNRITTPTQAKRVLRQLYHTRVVDVQLVDDAPAADGGGDEWAEVAGDE